MKNLRRSWIRRLDRFWDCLLAWWEESMVGCLGGFVGQLGGPQQTAAVATPTRSPRRRVSRTALDADRTAAFSSSTYTVAENTMSFHATITVNLNQAPGQTVTLDYATANGTATAGSDYTATSGTLTFLMMDTSKTFNIPISQRQFG